MLSSVEYTASLPLQTASVQTAPGVTPETIATTMSNSSHSKSSSNSSSSNSTNTSSFNFLYLQICHLCHWEVQSRSSLLSHRKHFKVRAHRTPLGVSRQPQQIHSKHLEEAVGRSTHKECGSCRELDMLRRST